ncbi:hypothetical protein MRX96_037308 [Rhipicephalus microplus]
MTSVKSTDLTTTTVEPTESMGTSTATSPPASNTSTVTEATTEPVFPAQAPMTPFPVVRVFGTATNESQPLPADDVCDYTFYDGLYDTGRLTRFTARTLVHQLSTFSVTRRFTASLSTASLSPTETHHKWRETSKFQRISSRGLPT